MLIDAVKNRDIEAVRRGIAADPGGAKLARVIVGAVQAAFLPAVQLQVDAGADLNALYRGYRPLHALLQESPHEEAGIRS